MRLGFLAAVIAATHLFCAPAFARPYTVDDLLRHEDLGKVVADPAGRWLVFEKRTATLAMTTQGRITKADVLRSRPYVVDLHQPGAARALLPNDSTPGTIVLGFSPHGQRLAIARLTGTHFRLGIVAMASGKVRWWPLAPSYDPFHTALAWLDEDRLILIAEPGDQPPAWLVADTAPRLLAQQRGAATAVGKLAVTVAGSGQYRNIETVSERRLIVVDLAAGRSHVLAHGPFVSLAYGGDPATEPDPDSGPRTTANTTRANTTWATTTGASASTESGPAPGRRPLPQPALRPIPMGRRSSTPSSKPGPVGPAQWIAITRQSRSTQPESGAPVHQDTPYLTETLTLVSPGATKPWTPCPDCELTGLPAWDASGRRVAALVSLYGAPRILVADVRTRQIVSIAAPRDRSEAAGSVGCPLSWHDGTLIVPAKAAAARPPSNQATGSLDMRVEGLCAHGPWPADGAAWQPAPWTARGARVALHVSDGHEATLPWAGDVRLERAETLLLPRAGDATLIRLHAVTGVEELILVKHGQVQRLMTINRHMQGIEPAIFQPIHHRGADGELVSWLVLPGGARSHALLPLVVIPYPGLTYTSTPPTDQRIDAERLYTSAQLLAASGFAVLLPSLPMPDQLPDNGFDFAKLIDPVIDAALASGCCDPQRIALWGHSYGAYAAVMASTQSQRYRAVVASAGIYDLAGTIGTFGPLTRALPTRVLPIASQYAWAEEGQGRMGAPPWAAPQRYLANSPVYLAQRIRAPMLITAADQDVSPLGQAEQLFSALFRQGKDAQLVTYWGEGHVVSSPANLHDLYGRVVAFLRDEFARPAPAHDGDVR